MRWLGLGRGVLGGVVILVANGIAHGDSATELPPLSETGRAAPTPLEGAEITPPPAAEIADSRERPIRPQVPQPPVGKIDPATLSDELDGQFGMLRDCLIEAARRERLPTTSILADTLTLRFSIQPTGKTAGVEVVASSATDPLVLSCAKAAAKAWTFTRPRGGPVAVQRDYKFPDNM